MAQPKSMAGLDCRYGGLYGQWRDAFGIAIYLNLFCRLLRVIGGLGVCRCLLKALFAKSTSYALVQSHDVSTIGTQLRVFDCCRLRSNCSILRRCGGNQAFELPLKVRLVGKPRIQRNLRERITGFEPLLRIQNAAVGQIGMRCHAVVGFECANKIGFTQPRCRTNCLQREVIGAMRMNELRRLLQTRIVQGLLERNKLQLLMQ